MQKFGASGPHVLFFHGIGTSATSWLRVMERLAAGFRCVAIDFRGYGDSADPTSDWSLDRITDEVLEVMEREGGEAPWHLVGVSFGALVALAVSRCYPERVASLCLSDATLGRGFLSPQERVRWIAMREGFADALDDVAEERARAITGPHPSDETIASIAASMRRARPSGYRSVARIIAESDALPWLPDVAHRTLVLCGVHDQVVGLALSETIAAQVPGATLVTFADSGHAPHVEDPAAFAAAVGGFIRTVEAEVHA